MPPTVLIRGLPSDVTTQQVRELCESVVGEDVLSVFFWTSSYKMEEHTTVKTTASAEIQVACREAALELVQALDMITVSLWQEQDRATQLHVSHQELY